MSQSDIALAVLVIFTASFCGICAWALWPANRERLKSYGLIPLNEDKNHD
ncbi:cbb3-type cytochrome oxidase component FixQ family protein [Asticcacaulis biprosthecium C19]|uniref:Cbb3-type cytochrome oxidase component FixQ family protein n=1 Tax=Asticcacaulis biprosthecium C19 TaxID=715226 RepID=F4QTG3_9CAUL|nr:cbb3-type cytochrome c oxidase subunit 3 [Asticcacaulis biprosthecium]EGF90033.1 cbb3-type cytochrome oxidase component FixQ family protein [Asticcacaulis biprosthecium C19]